MDRINIQDLYNPQIPPKMKDLLRTELLLGQHVYYKSGGQRKLEGVIMKNGILCWCKLCRGEKTVPVTRFELHAESTNKRPAEHICLENGNSLRDVLNAWGSGQDILIPKAIGVPEAGVAQSGLLCDLHDLSEDAPSANSLAVKGHTGIDALQEMKQQHIQSDRIMVDEIGECALCGGHYFSTTGFNDDTIIYCDQCEREFHVDCLRLLNKDDLKEVPQEKWFCCTECIHIRYALLKLTEESDKEVNKDSNIKWRLLSCASDLVNNKQLLDVAIAVFTESFGTIIDPNPSNNNTDLITKMVSGSESAEENYTGMYCAILTVNSSVVSVGLVRIFGKEVAELPLVATKREFQGKGYFQALFNCIENLLESLEVKNLVLPATHEAVSMWKHKFGFQKLKLDQRKLFQMYPIVNFGKSTMMHKSLLSDNGILRLSR